MTEPLYRTDIIQKILRNRRRKRAEFFLSKITRTPNMKVLDVGCGPDGRSLANFLQDCSITGIDLYEESEVKIDHPDFTYFHQDARDLSRFSDNEFELSFCIGMLEHICICDDLLRIAREIQRVSKQYIIVVPWKYAWIEPHFKFPFFQLFPHLVQCLLVRSLNLHNLRESVKGDTFFIKKHYQWLSKKEWRKIFPGSRIYINPMFDTISIIRTSSKGSLMINMRKGIERVRILNCHVDAVTMRQALEEIDVIVADNIQGCYILAVNPEKIDATRRNPLLKEMFKKAALLIPDGIGVVLAVRCLYGKKISRVPGADLMQNLCEMAARKGYRIFIYGAKEDVNKKAVKILNSKYPGINIVGRCNGYVDESRMHALVEEVNSLKTDILFIALGSPKQEKWIQRYLPLLNVKVCQGVGGTLDTIAGNVKRAPVFFQRMGLEWFYRLISEPKRIRRQIMLPVFAFNVLKEKIMGKN